MSWSWYVLMLCHSHIIGMPPFYSRNRDRLFHKILKAELRIPRFFSPEAKSLLIVSRKRINYMLLSVMQMLWNDFVFMLLYMSNCSVNVLIYIGST